MLRAFLCPHGPRYWQSSKQELYTRQSPQRLNRDHDAEEVRGHRDALAWIHAEASKMPSDEQTIKRLHALTRGRIRDAGQYQEQDGDIIERDPDSSERVPFRTVPAAETSARKQTR